MNVQKSIFNFTKPVVFQVWRIFNFLAIEILAKEKHPRYTE